MTDQIIMLVCEATLLFFCQLSSAQLSDNPFKALTRANCTCNKSSYFIIQKQNLIKE